MALTHAPTQAQKKKKKMQTHTTTRKHTNHTERTFSQTELPNLIQWLGVI